MPTIGDVAALASVSIGTVSKALNGRQGISTRTASQVHEAAEQLGFHSNALARSLLSGRSFTVGLITNDSFGRFSIPVMLGAEDALQTGQIAVLLCDGRDDPIREQHYMRTLLARRVDGIIVTGRRTDPRPPLSSDFPVPIVYAMSESANAARRLGPARRPGRRAAGGRVPSGYGPNKDRPRDRALPTSGPLASAPRAPRRR